MASTASTLAGFTEPVPFTKEHVRSVPRSSGVHVVIDADGVVVYVGETDNLRRRLGDHLQGRTASVLHSQVGELLDSHDRTASAAEIRDWLGRCAVAWRLTDDRIGLKAELITALAPQFNRQMPRGQTPRSGVRWHPLVRWAARFGESMDLDDVERAYKLEIRDHVDAAEAAAQAGDPGWPRILRRAFGSPNNLTAWQMHAKFLDWVDANPGQARATLLVLWDRDRDVRSSIEAFCADLPPEVSGSGTRTNLASFLLAARQIEDLPIYKPSPFTKAYHLTGWPHAADVSPGDRYLEALGFLDDFLMACRTEGVSPLRDRLDAQGLLWQVLAGEAPDSWSAAEVAAYQSFLKGQAVDELGELVEQFRSEVAYPIEGRAERTADRNELAAGLTAAALDNPDVHLLRKLAGQAYGSPGPQPGFYKLLQAPEDTSRVTATLEFLLYGPGDVVERLDECIGGPHKLPGVAEAIMVKALAVRHPERWLPCFVTRGKVGKSTILALLSETIATGPSPGVAAAATNDRLRELLEPHFPNDPWGMQEFTWWLLHREHVPDTTVKPLADELYLSEAFLARILRLLDDKGQVVFYGPPGTGKTYVARRLAGYIARGGGTVEKVQFHPSYSYEDFVEGYRPRLVDGQVTYEIVDGPLKRMASTAQDRPDVTHVLVVDELNRANVAKVLGELLFLMEYRGEEIRLQYSDTPFALPHNLQIIATMNTADRSIALVDTALRRRFHFVPFFPDVPPIDSLLHRWLEAEYPSLGWLADLVDKANDELANRNLAIGPSHFMRPKLTEEMARLAWENSVVPFLEEHFFADPDQLERFDFEKLKSGGSQDAPRSLPEAYIPEDEPDDVEA